MIVSSMDACVWSPSSLAWVADAKMPRTTYCNDDSKKRVAGQKSHAVPAGTVGLHGRPT